MLGLLPAVLMGVAAAAVVASLGAVQSQEGKAWSGLIFGALILLAYVLCFAVIGPYFAARMQNLAWNATRSDAVSFSSQLTFKALFWLTLKNWTLVALTLSLYRPFAAVQTARLRLEAVSLTATEDVAQWSARAPTGMQDATGDVAGDFFGIDMGL
jgi:uncharacterized membrane protein YjgN (DUF898 family)